MQALVIGGTGPTGYFIVNGLRARGYSVAVLHTGNHEIPEIPDDVEHIHTDPYSADALEAALAGRDFDVCVATYGRLRAIAKLMQGRVGRFISVGGMPAYRGYMNPMLFEPEGLPVPTREDSPLVREKEEDEKGWRIVRTEESVFEFHPEATHFRYPYVYGPYQLVPREWMIVKRILDKRPHIIVPDDGLTLHSFGYTENLAHAVLLAVDKPDAAKGQIYNCADDEILSLRQVIEIIAASMDYPLEIISMPWELAIPAKSLMMQPIPTHRVVSIAKLRQQLGYRDVVKPAEALARTARWLVQNPPQPDGQEQMVLQDAFDYEAEDQLIAAWKNLLKKMPTIAYREQPNYGLHYSGPGGRPRSKAKFE